MNIIQQASAELLQDDALDPHTIEQLLGKALVSQVDYADLFLQSSREESWFIEEGIVKRVDFDMSRGFGLRILSGQRTGFAYADAITHPALQDAVSSAKSIAHQNQAAHTHIQSAQHPTPLYTTNNPVSSLQDQEKVDLLRKIDTITRQKDPRVKEVKVSLSASHDTILILNSLGEWSADIRPLVSMQISVTVQHHGRQETGRAGGGGRTDYHCFIDNDLFMTYIDKAIAQALINCEAKPAPAGSMPVILGPGWPAVLLHEAVGHGLEADFNRKGSSIYSNAMNQQVASKLCTIVDDGTVANRRGSLTIDDEGTPSQQTMLIENGYLKGYMYDRLNASLMGVQSTGNGRRESYSSVTLPRMTNTYMMPGDSDPHEIIASVKDGIYAVDFSGGSVDITSGEFVFSSSEAYRIKNGNIEEPIKGATLIGNGPDILKRISMVGNDLALDSGQGTCGKSGQSVEVGVGQPTIKIEHMTVGGSAKE